MDRKIGLRAVGLLDLALSIDGHEFVLNAEEALRLGDMLQRARVCPLCEQLMLLEKTGIFPEHGCGIVVAVSEGPPPSAQTPKRTLRLALPARKLGPGGGETEPRRLGPRESKRGGVAAENYVLHIPRAFTTPKAGTFTFCNRRAVDVNCVDSSDMDKIESNPDAQCRVCMAAWRKSSSP